MTTYAGLYQAALHLPLGASAVRQQVEVRTAGGAAATLWADKDRSVPLTNPAPVDSAGDLAFFAEPGEYDLVLRGVPTRIVVPRHPDEPTASPSFVDARQGVNAVAWDGVTDDTTRLAALATSAVAAGLPLLLPPGTGLVGTWTPPSGLILDGAGAGTMIKQKASATGTSAVVVDLTGTTGVTLRNLVIDGNLSAFGGVGTEHKHGIQAKGATDLTLTNVVVQNCKGDGVYVGRNGSTHSARVTMVGCKSINNYRNNLSVVSCSGARFIGCDFRGANGTSPQCGVDVEPNTNADTISDIMFVACSMDDNAGYGFASTLYSGGLTQERVVLLGCTMNRNTLRGVYLYGTRGYEFHGCEVDSNTLDGVIFQDSQTKDTLFSGGRITKNGHHGILGQPPTGATIANTKILGTVILDNGIGAAAGTYYGMVFGLDSNGGTIDGLLIEGVTSGNRDTSSQKYGAYYSALCSNTTVKNNDFRGNATAAAIFNDDASTRRAADNLGVTEVSGISGSAILASNVKRASCTPGAGGLTLTLPAAPEPNVVYEIFDANGTAGTNNITVVANTGHTIRNNSGACVLNANWMTAGLEFRANSWRVLWLKS